MKSAMQRKIAPVEPIWLWITECAADTFNRCFKRVTGGGSTQIIAAFGEKVPYHLPKVVVARMSKSDPRWCEGILLGLYLRSDEY